MTPAGAPSAPAAPAPPLAPGRMGVRLAVLSLAIGLAAVNTGNNLLYVMLSLLMGLAVTATLAARRAMRTLSVKVDFPPEVVCGEPFLATVEASGRFPWLPQTWVDVRVEGLGEPLSMTVAIPAGRRGGRATMAIPWGGRGRSTVAVPAERGRAGATVAIPTQSGHAGSTVAVPLRCGGRSTARVVIPRRGVHTQLGVSASTGYPLDLSVTRARSTWKGDLVVLPRFDPILPPWAPGGAWRRQIGSFASPEAGTGADLRQVRDYTWTDDARRIHWRATARAGRPMVRELEHEREREIHLVLDTEASDPKAFEDLVSRAAALLDAAGRDRVAARLFSQGAPDEGLTGAQAARFLAQVAPAPPGTRRSRPAGIPAGAHEGAIVLSCDPRRATPLEAA